MNVASLQPTPHPFSLNAQAIKATKSSNTAKGRKIESPPPEKIKSQLFQESHSPSPVTSPKSKIITESPGKTLLAKSTPTKDIIITDSGKTLDIASAWEEIDYQLQDLIGVSPEHLEKAKQDLQNLTVCEFQYIEDLVDQLVLQLNAEEGTNYPLTGDLETGTRDDEAKTSGKVQKFFKFMVAALATEAICTNLLSQVVAAGNNTNSPKFTYGSVSTSEPVRTDYFSRLPNACLTQSPRYRMKLRDGDSICVPGGDGNSYYYFHKKKAKSVTVSTGHGSGDLSLSVKNGYWPGLYDPPSSNKRGNTECVIIKDFVSSWTYIAIRESREKATLAIRFDATRCLAPMADETATPLRLPTVLPLADMCAKEQAITPRGPLTGLRGNNAICLPDGNQSTYNFYAFALKPPKSIAITTSHGSGDLTLWARGGRWPILDEKPLGSTSDNNQCFVIQNNDQFVTYITVKGDWENASMAIDFDKASCREPLRPGFAQATDDRTDGYPYTGAVLLVYKLNFPDAKLNWPSLEGNLTATREYFKDQSYDNFAVSWQTVEVDILESVDNFTGSQNRDKWEERCREIVEGTGVNWPNPGTDKIIMLASPNAANLSHIGDNTVINARDNTNDIGVIAFGMGNAMGLRPAYALEAGSEIIRGLPEDDSVVNCNGQTSCINASDQHPTHNILSVMGSGAGPINLLYKSFFGWLDLDNDVPMVNASGLYRIHTFDRGDKSNGPVGLRIPAGNGDYTYWLEYRTTGRWSDNTQQGVLINLEDIAPSESNTNPRYWKTKSYLLDMTPGSKNSTNWQGEDFTDAALTVGQSYTDHWGGFTITPRRVGGTEKSADAWIEIDVAKTPDEKTDQSPKNSTGIN